MSFKEGVIIVTNDFWYDLLDNNYIKPEDILKSTKDIELINNAIRTLLHFKNTMEESEVIIYT